MTTMKHELEAVVQLIKRLLLAHNKETLTEPQVTRFINCFCEILRRHCILQDWLAKDSRKNTIILYVKDNKVDSHFVSACECTGISVSLLKQVLPAHLFIWMDPGHVTYRLGQNGAIVTVYEHLN